MVGDAAGSRALKGVVVDVVVKEEVERLTHGECGRGVVGIRNVV